MKFSLKPKIFLLVILLSGCQKNQALYKDTQVLMGTFVEVTSPDQKSGKIVFDEFKRIDNLLSKYRTDSEVSRLNKLGKLRVGLDTFYIIKKSKEFWQISDGAFDITAAVLVDLWGFTDKKYYLPMENEIKKALKFVGSDKIILNDKDNMVEFKTSGVKIDLGGIAKGYALDCAVKKLKENNITSCLINAGGQVFALGDKFGKPWRIAIKGPRAQGMVDYLKLKDNSVSTSGDYEQYFIKNNKRYSHILDPKTGYPVNTGLESVTVIAHCGLDADALSTAIFVLGKTRGEDLIKRFPGAQARFIEENASHNK